ncbi:MAG TPA: hypothetical protein O0W84_04765 [Methanocorpusculum sp.]|nr:hypothetical protein [Methanocorpusculum sp.]
MIFPVSCKFVGNASSMPHGEKVYFLSQYLLRKTANGIEILAVEPADGDGLIREIKSLTLLARADEVHIWEGAVNPHNRADLIRKALSTGKRATVFGNAADHMTFVLDPSLDEFETVHVFDNTPPKASLSETLKALESIGYFEPDNIIFEHHIEDISEYRADVYPCKASGYARTLDRANVKEGDTVACCKTGRQICEETSDAKLIFRETCPVTRIDKEPFIARCCRMDEAGIQVRNGCFGVVVHWAAPPREIAEALDAMLSEWRLMRK